MPSGSSNIHTLITPVEISQSLTSNLKSLWLKLIEEIKAEPWKDMALNRLDLEWLLIVNKTFLRKLLTASQEDLGFILLLLAQQ